MAGDQERTHLELEAHSAATDAQHQLRATQDSAARERAMSATRVSDLHSHRYFRLVVVVVVVVVVVGEMLAVVCRHHVGISYSRALVLKCSRSRVLDRYARKQRARSQGRSSRDE
jgi:hypothetical protein